MKHLNLTTKNEIESDAERLVAAIANTAARDLADEIVVPDGVNMDYMMAAKAIYWNHLYDEPPIGTLRKAHIVKEANASALRVVFYVSDKTQRARDVYELIKEDVVRGVSVGFEATSFGAPTEDEVEKYGPASTIVRQWNWRELSVTPMPCNPEAWITGVKSLAGSGQIAKSWLDELRIPSKTIVFLDGDTD